MGKKTNSIFSFLFRTFPRVLLQLCITTKHKLLTSSLLEPKFTLPVENAMLRSRGTKLYGAVLDNAFTERSITPITELASIRSFSPMRDTPVRWPHSSPPSGHPSQTRAPRSLVAATAPLSLSLRTFASSPQPIKKQVLYRGKGIKIFRVLVRLKIFQLGGVAALAIPISTFLSTGNVSPYQTVIAGALVIGSAAASIALAFFSRRYVGELSLLHFPRDGCGDDTNVRADAVPREQVFGGKPKARFSVLDFWGRREDIDVDLEDVVPPFAGLEQVAIASLAMQPALPIAVSGSHARQYIVSLRYGDLVDKEGLRALLEGRYEELNANR
jgi:hypothetical protein